MCAIAGVCQWSGVQSDRDVANLVERMRHRGRDDVGVWRSPSDRCVLGHARLSIIDLSAAGHQPMVDPLTGNTVVFNGEIYNFQEQRADCMARGDTFRSDSDTEVILGLYRRHGIECLRFLRGMFAFALWDESKQSLLLARDRLGKKPLHYAIDDGRIVFASELDALARYPAVNRELDEEALALYLQLQYIPAPWTIYRSIRKLPPAHVGLWDRSGFHLTEYWTVDYTRKIKIDEEEAVQCLDEKLREAIKIRMTADVPLGALLSGGVDSSLVVALMANVSNRTVKTYSIGFKELSHNELPFAQAVAQRYGTDHHWEIIDGEQEPMLHKLVQHYGEPYADPSALPSFCVCRQARSHVKVAVNGDGGDELLGGYPRYSQSRWGTATAQLLGGTAGSERLAQLASEGNVAATLAAKIKGKWLRDFIHPELRCLSVYRAFWSDRDTERLLSRSNGRARAVTRAWRAHWLGAALCAADNPIDRMLWIDNHTYLPGALLVKMDIASMHCGLEARSPLLDHELVEFCASLPVEFKVKRSIGKYLLKRVAERYLPHGLLYRPKMGFDFPMAGWLRGALRPLVQEVLRDSELLSPLDSRVVEDLLEEFYGKGIDHSSRIWAVLMFSLWKKTCFSA